jgi:hypothetical protein
MDIAGHVSRQMLARYSHGWMQAKRNALEQISNRVAGAENVQRPKLLLVDQKIGHNDGP